MNNIYCFICKGHFKNIAVSTVHFKIFHSITPSSSFTCGENSCSQTFFWLSKFKRHKHNENDMIPPYHILSPPPACTSTCTLEKPIIFVENPCSGDSTEWSFSWIYTQIITIHLKTFWIFELSWKIRCLSCLEI